MTMAQNYIQPGNVMDFLNTGNPVFSGDVVTFPDRIGVALVNIPTGGVGSVQMTGVFRIPKATGEALQQGSIVHWSAGTVTAAPGAVQAGMVWQAAGATDAYANIKLICG